MTDKLSEKLILKILSSTNSRGYLKSRESTSIEFKENFSFGNFPSYLKTVASFANNRGGIILFGIKDSPRIPAGINKKKFDEIQVEKVTTFLSEYFSPTIDWQMGTIDYEEKSFGYFEIIESDDKPVICKKDKDKILKNGTVYYRYHGQSKVIEFPELKKIHIEIKEKEKKLWMSHIERIAQIGPKNIALVDLFDGKIESDNLENTFVLDENLLAELKSKVKFVEEGNFSETDGDPTLKVIGKVETVKGIIAPTLDPDKDYPYLAKHLAQELQIRPYDAQVLIWKYGFKGNKKYHLSIQASKNSQLNKYSKYALRKMREKYSAVDDKTNYLKKTGKEFQKQRQLKRK